MELPTPFRLEYHPGTIRFGAGSVAALSEELAVADIDRALICCGESVGATPGVIDPVEAGLGDRHAGTFAGTSARKALVEAAGARTAYREHGADAFVALGGGSALDVAKAAAVLTASGQSVAEAAAAVVETGTLPIPDGDLPPVVAVPTTLSGADLSQLAGLTATPDSGGVDRAVGGGLSDRRLMPTALFYDAELFRYTPACRESLPTLGGGTDDRETLERAVAGVVLAQYGASRPDGSTLSVIHALGHGLTAVSDVQQGAAHAAVAPDALRYLFERVDGRRDLLAEGLGVDAADPAAMADGVVTAVETVRDGLGLPTRLRDTSVPESELDRAAEITHDDALMMNAPERLSATVEGLRGVLADAW
jgi:alcohol dehydrogenase